MCDTGSEPDGLWSCVMCGCVVMGGSGYGPNREACEACWACVPCVHNCMAGTPDAICPFNQMPCGTIQFLSCEHKEG